MKLTNLYSANRKFPVITCGLTVLCILISVPTFFSPNLFSFFALSAPPKYWWQIFTFIFEHNIEPKAVLWIHLGMNLFGLIPFGILTEKILGSKVTISLCVTEWLATLIIYFFMRYGQDTTVAGISSIGFAFAAIAFYCFAKFCRIAGKGIWKQPLTYFFVLEFFGIVSTQNPVTGAVSFCLHFSGLAFGFLFCFFLKNRINDYFDKARTQL